MVLTFVIGQNRLESFRYGEKLLNESSSSKNGRILVNDGSIKAA